MNTLDAAVRNNAAWCECVCRSHDARGTFTDAYWQSGHTPPRFYPDLITLSPAKGERQMKAIADLSRPTWHVKDSFACLDLSVLGAKVIIEAHWQVRAPTLSKPDVEISRIDSEDELAEWERLWADDPKAPRVFLSGLLSNKNIDFIALRRAGKVVAGAILNRSHGVCGFTNLFGAPDDAARLVSVTPSFADRLPIVFYAPAAVSGSTPLGLLRVWARM